MSTPDDLDEDLPAGLVSGQSLADEDDDIRPHGA